MLRVACIGWNYFFRCLPADTFEVRTIALGPDQLLTWEAICREYAGQPDILIYCDRSIPPPLPGLERFPCLTVFCCIDSHIHSWYTAYAQFFDVCTISLRDHLPRFIGRLTGDRLLWSPPSAVAAPQEALAQEQDKTCDVLFVGKVDPELTPQRAATLDALRARQPGLVVTTGDWRSLYPTARLVLNIAEGGDLNFRVFEALATGACLLTPEVGHGQAELFTNGEHLFTYPPGDVDALDALIRSLLPDAARRATVARQGLEIIRARHEPSIRAAQFAQWLVSQPAEELVRRRLESEKELTPLRRMFYALWAETLRGDPRAAIYMQAAKGDIPV